MNLRGDPQSQILAGSSQSFVWARAAETRTMKAVVYVSSKATPVLANFAVKDDVPKPQPADTQLLVKVEAAAINPVDLLIGQLGIFMASPLPFAAGCDFCGTVEAVGAGDAAQQFAVGDRVFGYTGLGKAGFGTFAEYAVVEASVALKCNAATAMSSAQLASVGVGMLTAALGLFHALGLPMQCKAPGTSVLIWGASGSVGSWATQLARAAGYSVIAVCSARNFDYVKQLGAQHVVDYGAPDAVAQIRALGSSSQPIRYAFSTISSASCDLCVECLAGTADAKLSSCQGAPTKTVEPAVPCESVFLGSVPNPGPNMSFVEQVRDTLCEWFDEGKLIPGRVRELHGLDSVMEGLQMVSAGMSGEKVVVVF
ncbi:Trans-enoyl reductase ccsC [Porphyridium purpureum]|uniref:Trans-enoyl reductase ccsC n=1 Tax=Porphyridium purpureum TaxID=35688 RepID=A0A5J4YUJ9_PORPP|nr:Trans-enoyl reductase ccsC [Porphyridium purpureum]|eukprot:POR5453..scf227_4